MSIDTTIAALEFEWSPEGGFFWRIRQGQFFGDDFERALRQISAIRLPDDGRLPRRVVALLWYIPLFMHWQRERVIESGHDPVAYDAAIGLMTTEIERLLGVP